MNPFAHPLPPDAAGQRGFDSAEKAKAAALAQPEVKTFAIMACKQEFAWVAPQDLVLQRLAPAMMAGITVIEWGSK